MNYQPHVGDFVVLWKGYSAIIFIKAAHHSIESLFSGAIPFCVNRLRVEKVRKRIRITGR